MKIKLLEIRDRATFIPVFAMRPLPTDSDQRFLLRRAGFSCQVSDNIVIMGYLRGGGAHYDPYDWGDSRTMKNAHLYITEHWDELSDGDVIDVEFILGETTVRKASERFDDE